MANDRRAGLRVWDRLVLLVAWLVTCGLVYLLGFYVGRGTQEHRFVATEERIVRLPVTSAPPPEGQRPKSDSELTFYDTLVAGQAGERRPTDTAAPPTAVAKTTTPTAPVPIAKATPPEPAAPPPAKPAPAVPTPVAAPAPATKPAAPAPAPAPVAKATPPPVVQPARPPAVAPPPVVAAGRGEAPPPMIPPSRAEAPPPIETARGEAPPPVTPPARAAVPRPQPVGPASGGTIPPARMPAAPPAAAPAAHGAATPGAVAGVSAPPSTAPRPNPAATSSATAERSAAAAPAVGSGGSGAWTVLASPTRNRDEAEALLHQLRERGYDAALVRVQRDGDAWYRLRVGRYATADQAATVMHKLREHEGVEHVFVANE